MKKYILKTAVLYLILISIAINLCACTPQTNVEPEVNSHPLGGTTETETDDSYLELASSNYAYNQLGKQSNGEAKQTLYNRIKHKAPAFHNGALAKKNVAFTVEYGDLGLSEEDIFQVWMGFKDDNPIYYWISNIYSYTDNDRNGKSCMEPYQVG